MTNTTPAQVAAAATIPNGMHLDGVVVIGIMKAQDGHAALLRSPHGQIKRVGLGQAAFGYDVTGIADTYVILTDRSGQTVTLVMQGRYAAAS